MAQATEPDPVEIVPGMLFNLFYFVVNFIFTILFQCLYYNIRASLLCFVEFNAE